MHRSNVVFFGLILGLAALGCARVVVTKNPGDCDQGLRFYRPKPFLLVTPDKDNGIAIELKYLPDYSEEYSIRMTPGLNATATFNPKLENGWNLTGFESTTDQNVDDLIASIGEALPKFAAANKMLGGETKAENVPFGFYEAVILCDDRGCKRLMGWRYVGFFAYSSAPPKSSELTQISDASEGLWNLVWKGDGVTFERVQ